MVCTIWFMGRPAAGKSTLAKSVEQYIREQDLPVENLDGDEIREHMHPDLGFTREDRAINNRRTAFICQLLNRHGINVITGMITPFRDAQQQARDIIEADGNFVLVHVRCSVEEAKRRDPKDLYAQAEAGNIDNFTGVNHPFQEPHNPEIVVDTEQMTVEESIEHVLHRLQDLSVLDVTPREDYDIDITRREEQEIRGSLENRGFIE
jgi:adenylyl-sulfate kinase